MVFRHSSMFGWLTQKGQAFNIGGGMQNGTRYQDDIYLQRVGIVMLHQFLEKKVMRL